MATKLEFLVAKKKMLVALPTVSVAIWSPVGWKHHEAPWGEYYNSPPPPMDGRGTENKPEGLHSESLSWLEAPWSEYYNSTHHPTAPPCMEC